MYQLLQYNGLLKMLEENTRQILQDTGKTF